MNKALGRGKMSLLVSKIMEKQQISTTFSGIGTDDYILMMFWVLF